MKTYSPGDKVKYNGQIVTVRALHQFASGDRYFIELPNGQLAYAHPASVVPLLTPRPIWKVERFAESAAPSMPHLRRGRL